MSKTVRTTLIASVALLAAGCTASTVPHVRNPGANSPAPGAPQSPPAGAAPARPGAPSVPPGATGTGNVGDEFTLDGGRGKYKVQLVSVDQNAQPTSEFDRPEAGHHFAAAQFRVTGVTRTDENSNLSASATGSNHQSYTSRLLEVANGTNFASGSVKLAPGSSLVGWVPFQVPDGVDLTRVQWAAGAGTAHQAEWVVNKSFRSSPAPGTPEPTEVPTIPSSPGPGLPPPPGPNSPAPQEPEQPEQPSPPAPPEPGPAPAPTEETPAPSTPETRAVVAYEDAINRHDYRQAFALGGRHASASYPAFVRGLRSTQMVSAETLRSSGNVVTSAITVLDTNGTTRHFRATYTVRNGVITRFRDQPAS